MAGMLDMDRSRNRRDRTFIGNRCAVCDEPLEHTLRGERVLQFSCAHVSHEACFYEYIKEVDTQFCPECNAPLGLDSSRGGNVLDIGMLPTPHYESYSTRTRSRQGSRTSSLNRESRVESRGDVRDSTGPRHENGHWRNNSGVSGGEFPDPALAPTTIRRHDYDVQSLESELNSRNLMASPIPPPTVTVKSEFPTITRSKAQQSLTCLVTVEIPDRKMQPLYPEDSIPPVPALPTTYEQSYHPSSPTNRSQYSFEREGAGTRQRERDVEKEQENEVLAAITDDLRLRVENWHGLDFGRFGKLRLHGTIKVGKDCQAWQELECYLFSEMLICVKDKKSSASASQWTNGVNKKRSVKCTLKGSILIKKHLKKVSDSNENMHILTLSLSVAELPQFHLLFPTSAQMDQWHRALLDLNAVELASTMRSPRYEDKRGSNSDEDDDFRATKTTRRVSSVNSAYSGTHGGGRSVVTAPTEYTASIRGAKPQISPAVHIPLDIVVVIPVSSSMQGLKINLIRDSLKFLIHNLGERDRMGLVTFGSSSGGVALTPLSVKSWSGWAKVVNSIRPVGQKSLRTDVVDGANVAMDLLMQRKSSNPIASILLISDSSTSDTENVDFVVSRAEAAKITIHSFGLGLTHKPDTMIELSTRTKGQFTYVKDWMMLRECVAGCIGALQTLSHQNAKLRLKLPEGSPARFVKISGALHVSKRSSGREAEAALGDLHFGDKKDVLVQLVISPDSSQGEMAPQDAWESIVSGLEALGGSADQDESRTISIEEVPLIQADLTYGDIQRDGTLSQLSRPHLLAITMLPASPRKGSRPGSPPIPPHPMVVQRRMELLTSDMLSRALTLISRGQHDRAHTLLTETRTILKGLGKGGLPPLPSPSPSIPLPEVPEGGSSGHTPTATPPLETNFTPASVIDAATVSALDAELESALEWISHPAVFARDSRKAVLQAIGVIASQRSVTFRTACESIYAQRVAGVKRLSIQAREWRDTEDSLMEED
ncbi:unnamed protein product [Tuber melanosporum]|uniref:(Perigord truffle) hypothetical protein n=1 Tax=Tuber melanosporum (strain Mel28) TaxID=656061 RepID=D5G6T9_TUBMM|nr:uncharacterized protein GSTUM_00002107001 [Tuber melanosporum]CAZ80230.1 unnamed protein product [Tuber melanosporum]